MLRQAALAAVLLGLGFSLALGISKSYDVVLSEAVSPRSPSLPTAASRNTIATRWIH